MKSPRPNSDTAPVPHSSAEQSEPRTMETHQTPRKPEPNTILTIVAGSAAAAAVDHLLEWIGSSGWTLFTGWLEMWASSVPPLL